jgi:hypothetical protein
MGSLLASLGDALLGQDLAQPGMLVVHMSLLLLHRSPLLVGHRPPASHSLGHLVAARRAELDR